MIMIYVLTATSRKDEEEGNAKTTSTNTRGCSSKKPWCHTKYFTQKVPCTYFWQSANRKVIFISEGLNHIWEMKGTSRKQFNILIFIEWSANKLSYLFQLKCNVEVPFLFKIIKLLQLSILFLPVLKHFFVRGRSSRATQMFLCSEIGSDFASINSKDG